MPRVRREEQMLRLPDWRTACRQAKKLREFSKFQQGALLLGCCLAYLVGFGGRI